MKWHPLKTKTFWLDAFERIRNSFIQGAIGVAASAWAVSGLDLSKTIADYSAWQKLAAALIAGGVTAAAATVKVIYAGLKTGTASTSEVVAATAVQPAGGDVTILPPLRTEHAPEHEAL